MYHSREDIVHHYDLLAHPDWIAKSALIVTPYVEREFFERITHNLHPENLIVVIDDGCRAEDVRLVHESARNGTRIQVVLGSAPGLVHAKVFHIEWSTPGGVRKHTLVYGSGNATKQAFNGSFNSEVLCKVQLTAANHDSILRWIEGVRAAAVEDCPVREILPVRDAWIAKGVSIRLPAITIRDATSKASNFDLWLQRGRLLSKFDGDPGFLRVNVKLRRPLPPGEAQKLVQELGFEMPVTQRLAIPYVSTIEGEGETDVEAGNWRSRLFVWTNLGYWCSDACFRQWQDHFKKRGHQGRVKNLERLAALNDAPARDRARSNFIDRVKRLAQVFGDEAHLYLECLDGAIDHNHYNNLFDQRVDRDFALADDVEYVNRYIHGYEIIDVPRFRVDSSSWRLFAESFFRQIHLELLKSKSNSLIFQYIYWIYFEDDRDSIVDYKDFLEIVRNKWNEMTLDDEGDSISVGDYVASYYKRFQ